MNHPQERLVVIGNGMAGMKTVEVLLSANPDKYQITVFGAEPYGNYNRIMLSPVLCGEKNIKDIMINDRQWYTDNNITLNAGPTKEVVSIVRSTKHVVTKDGSRVPYDKLLIATGSNPYLLPIPGHDLDGVIGFRDIYDVKKMVTYSEQRKYAIVLGGGLLGLEAANGLAQRGMHVTVIHSRQTLLNRQLDSHAGKLLQHALEARGVNFKLNVQTQEIKGDANGHVKTAHFSDNDTLPCDLFVMAIGVRPNITLAKAAGIHCDRGIVVSDTLQTYDPSIYAVGECIQHRENTFGLVAPLFEQGKVCANHLAGHGVAEYFTLPTATKLKVTGINLFSVGDFEENLETQSLIFEDKTLGVYKKIVLKNNQLTGAVLYGDTRDGPWYQQLLEEQRSISDLRETLLFGPAEEDSQPTGSAKNPSQPKESSQ